MENKKRILLVDDHQIVLDGIKSMLSKHERFEVAGTALSGEEAREKYFQDETGFDIVIIDISLPGMNGIELCREIKTHDRKVKVMILTMHNQASYIREAVSCEADGYMMKNCGKKDFIKALNELTDKGCYFAYDILPFVYHEIEKEKKTYPAKLTPRETEVLKLILQELTSREIAEKLFISKQTVDTHRLSIMEKTSSKSVVGLIKYAINHKLM